MILKQEKIDRLLLGFEWSERATEIPFLIKHLPEPPLKVLDIGCNESILPIILKEQGYDCWALDWRPYEHSFEQFVRGDARLMPFEDNSFDAVTCISTIEHIGFVNTPYHTDEVFDEDGDIKAFNEIVRVLKPNGTIIITMPYGRGNKGMEHWVRFYDKERINKLFKNCEIDKITYSVHALDEATFEMAGDGEYRWTEVDEVRAADMRSEPNKVLSNVCILGHKL